MTLLSRKVDYALLILSYLYRRAEGGSAREIASRFDISRAFVANILKVLCTKGFVASHRGVKGGYVLQRSADEVRLADLMDSLDDSFHLTPCTKMASEEVCALERTCPVRGGITEVHERIRDVLRSVKLTELFGPVVPRGETQFGLEVGSTGRAPLPVGV